MEQTNTILPKAVVDGLIEQVTDKLKAIPAEQIDALQCIEMLFEITGAYAEWNKALQEELVKCITLNQSQGELLKKIQASQSTIIRPN